MSDEIPTPNPVKTKHRCKFFSVLGFGLRFGNCRKLGCYIMAEEGIGYCLIHYNARWKFLHPLHGTQHVWGERVPTYCERCGVMRPYKGFPVGTCPGYPPKLSLRASLLREVHFGG